MTVSAAFVKQIELPAAAWPVLEVVLGVIVLAALAIPLLSASAPALTPDESLYVSEALNLAEGKGFTYTTGEAVTNRGPLFPALVAGEFAIGGFSLDHAYVTAKLMALASAVLLLVIGWRFFGREAGLLAAALALASSLLNVTGAGLFPDTTQSFFLLLTLLLIHPALLRGRPLLAGLSGATLGLAILTKESALLWVPIPFLAVLLLGPAVRSPLKLLAAYSVGLLAIAGWWWPYVFVVTGDIYLLGGSWTSALWLAAAALAVAAIAAASISLTRRGVPLKAGANGRWALTAALLLIWGTLFIVGMERNAGWAFPPDYFTNVPDYTANVLASWVQPLPLIGLAWAYVAYRGYKGSLGDRILLLGLSLFLPFVIVVANRSLPVRDMLPLVYLSYIALGRSAVDFARWLAQLTSERLDPGVNEGLRPALGGAIAAVLVIGAFAWYALEEGERFAGEQDAFNATAVGEANWNNPLALETAAWIETNVPAGASIMSGRLYSTHLYTLTGAQYPLWQLPTVRVDIDTGGLTRADTLFRWEDHLMPSGVTEPWLYVRRHPVDGYYIGLSERDLIAGLREHEVEYLILTGDDAGFSSLSLLPYFENHPYFTLMESFVADDVNQTHIFQVVGSFDEPTNSPALVNGATVEALEAKLGPEPAKELLEGLSPGGYATSSAYAAVRPPVTVLPPEE